MSGRAQRRKAATGGKRGGKGGGVVAKWGFRILGVLVFAVIFAGFGLYFWLKSYLHSDDFRVFVGNKVGAVMAAEARFELFEWQGMHARTAGFLVEDGGVIRRMTADGVQGNVSLAGARRGVWEIPDVRVSRLELKMDTSYKDDEGEHADDEKPDSESLAAAAGGKGFLGSLLPDRAELSSVDILSLNLKLHTAGGDLMATDVAMKVERDKPQEAYGVQLTGGVIDASWFGSPLDLRSANGKYKDGHIYLNDSRSQVYERGLLTLKGEVDGARYAFYGVLTGVRTEEMVPEDWQKRITGDLVTRFKVRSTGEGGVLRGELELKKGVLTALPVLDRIAAYADTQRFRRLKLSDARLKFHKQGGRLDISEIVIACEGLVRVIGDLSVVDGRLDGRFRVGIMPGTLAHIPGAETKVFLRGDKGLLWAPLRITGTVDNPKEDLSGRMIAAAGERMFELVPETGEMALKFAHDTVTELPETAIDAGREIIGDGADVIKEGTGIIREGVGGVLDLIPGSSRDEGE